MEKITLQERKQDFLTRHLLKQAIPILRAKVTIFLFRIKCNIKDFKCMKTGLFVYIF